MAAVINQDDCVGCEACLSECPTECITMDGDKAVIAADDCVDCGACVSACPTECITM